MKYIAKLLKKDSSFIILNFSVWRIVLLVIALIAPLLVSKWGGRFPYTEEQLISSKLPYWLWVWGNFDGVHYLMIAKSSYLAYFTQTFFPFYPLLIRLLAKLLFNSYLIAALLISNIAFIGALFILNRMIILDGFRKSSRWIIVFLLFFPTSFYFGAVYSESIFLLLVLLSFYFARLNKWFFASLFGAFASATRLFGVFLLPSLIIEFYLQKKRPKKIQLLYFLLIPAGLIVYMFYLNYRFNDPLLFWHAQPAFGAERSGSTIILPPQVIFRYIKILASVSIYSSGFWNALYELVSFIYVVILLIFAHIKKIPFSYLVFSWLCLLLPSFTGTFSSMPRYVLVAFPIFIILGLIKNRQLKIFILLIHFVILLISAIFFTRGYWIS